MSRFSLESFRDVNWIQNSGTSIWNAPHKSFSRSQKWFESRSSVNTVLTAGQLSQPFNLVASADEIEYDWLLAQKELSQIRVNCNLAKHIESIYSRCRQHEVVIMVFKIVVGLIDSLYNRIAWRISKLFVRIVSEKYRSYQLVWTF